MTKLDFKTRQLAIRDYIGMVKTYFIKALLAQYNAIISAPIPVLCYGHTGNRERFSQANIITAPSTPSSPSIFFVLSKSSTINSSPSESHNTPSKYTWVKDPYWWRYYLDGEYTGVAIDKITELKITPHQTIKLKEASYRILFSPPNDNSVYHMVECPSLKKAKRVAELYYAEWDSVNHIRGEPVNRSSE